VARVFIVLGQTLVSVLNICICVFCFCSKHTMPQLWFDKWRN